MYLITNLYICPFMFVPVLMSFINGSVFKYCVHCLFSSILLMKYFFRFLFILILRCNICKLVCHYFEKSKKQIPEWIRNLNSECGPILLLIPLKQSHLKCVYAKNAGINFTETEFVVKKKKIS